jgi:hypothetical protein
VIPTNHVSRQAGYHPEGKSFGCMPNAATLGALTPAQWLWEEYQRGKERAYSMKGKQAILRYLETHRTFTAKDGHRVRHDHQLHHEERYRSGLRKDIRR